MGSVSVGGVNEAAAPLSHDGGTAIESGGRGGGGGEWMPLYLSCIAGASTCIGAAIVFLLPPDKSDGVRRVGPGLMSFSLALAGSVMVTVSAISIGPECLAADDDDYAGEEEGGGSSPSSFLGGKMIPLTSWAFVQRVVAFGLGCLLYFSLSRFAFPEPEDVIQRAFVGRAAAVVASSKGDSEESESTEGGGGGSDKGGGGGGSLEEAEPTIVPPGGDAGSALSDVEGGGAAAAAAGTIFRDDAGARVSGGPADVGIRIRRTASKDSCDGAADAGHRNSDDDDETEALLVAPSDSIYRVASASSLNKNVPPSRASAGASIFSRQFSSGADLETKDQRKAWRVAMLLFVSLLFHNFPEGLAVAASALESEKLGITVTIGIMIHNVPEGIAIAIPCLAARPDRPCLSFALASVSGLAEPLGALVALTVLRGMGHSREHGDKEGGGGGGGEEDLRTEEDDSAFNLENVLAFVAGIMVTVALYELFPEARRHTHRGKAMYYVGTVCGAIIMILTELIV